MEPSSSKQVAHSCHSEWKEPQGEAFVRGSRARVELDSNGRIRIPVNITQALRQAFARELQAHQIPGRVGSHVWMVRWSEPAEAACFPDAGAQAVGERARGATALAKPFPL